jgi:2,3-bisphosphoglycerate-independent phosphoglycerate mutase
MGRVLFLFIDGVGIGRPDPATNPFVGCPVLGNFLPPEWSPPPGGARPERLPEPVRKTPVPKGGALRACDASLGVSGLPQSATGQTTLFTGVNGAEVLGHHLYGFPGPRLRKVLTENSILKRVTEAGGSAAFLNAYGPIFFELGDLIWQRPMSASSWNNKAAGLPFMTFEDWRSGRAMFHDYTGRTALGKGHDVPLQTAAAAGAMLAGAASRFQFSIYEFFMTDRVGHTGHLERAREIAVDLEAFIAAVLDNTDLETSHVILTSDHGNMEDMSITTHTHNPVPVMAWGPRAEALAGCITKIEDFCPAVLAEVTGESVPGRDLPAATEPL